LANLVYFAVEFGVGLHIGSVSLIAGSVDFLEDASVNFLILLALGWSLKARARMGSGLAILLLIPDMTTLWMLWHKFNAFTPPDPVLLSIAGAGALCVNLTCAFILARYRHRGGSLIKAAFLSVRNDAFANIGIIVAGLLTVVIHSAWPDLIVGIAIAAISMDSAKKVRAAAKAEHLETKS